MRRRTYLGMVSAGAVLTTGALVTARSSEDPPTDARRQVSLKNSGSISDGAPVAFELEMEDPWITSTSTSTFSITSVNKSNKDQQVSPAFLKGTSARNGDSGIVVYNHRARDFEIETYVPPCFSKGESETFVRTVGQGDEGKVTFTTEGFLPDTLEPGETKTEYFIIADDPTTERCFPSGSYHFEKSHTFRKSEVSLDFNIDVKSI